jgi:uncharacterized protein DUF4386
MDSTKRTAQLAGLAYLLLGIASFLGFVCVPLVRADPTAIANLITASELRFRIGIVSDLLSNVFGILLVWLLYQLLKPVDRNLAVLMAVLLLVTVPVSFIITLTDVAAKMLLSGANFLSAFTKPQLDALAMLFLRLHIHEVFAVEIFWGLWLFPFGVLVYKSRFLPRILGVFLIIAGFAYVAHSLISLLLPGPRHAVYELATMVGRGIGELPIIFWLLIKGVDSGAGKDAGAPRGGA